MLKIIPHSSNYCIAYELNNDVHNCWTSRVEGGVEFEWIKGEITRKGRKKRLERILSNRQEGEEASIRKSKNAQRVGKKVEVISFLLITQVQLIEF